jgi:hypothetical protein
VLSLVLFSEGGVRESRRQVQEVGLEKASGRRRRNIYKPFEDLRTESFQLEGMFEIVLPKNL